MNVNTEGISTDLFLKVNLCFDYAPILPKLGGFGKL
jgi:hypothetical protein